MIICMMMAAGCTRSEKKESDLPDVNELQDKEKDPDVVTFDNGQDGTDGEAPVFILKKEDADSLHHKAKRFVESVGKGKSVSLTMITVNGITHTGHWGDIHGTVTAEDLFEK